MPFKSAKQRAYLFANEPEVAEKFAKDGEPMTARVLDNNGWYEIKNNPLSKVGVFPYSGAMIDADGEMGLEPAKIYYVYRSAEELSSPETIKSFKLLPWIDQHQMLGDNKKGFTPAEKKGIDGVIGEDVYFKDDYLYGNIKLFSQELGEKIDSGTKELSLGYKCKYELQSGMYGDQDYDVRQFHIRGNHLASVPEGRMGGDVAVLDHKLTFTIDSKEFQLMDEDKKKPGGDDTGEMTISEISSVLKNVLPQVQNITELLAELKIGGSENNDMREDLAMDEKKKEEAKAEDEKSAAEAKEKESKAKAEDAKDKYDDDEAKKEAMAKSKSESKAEDEKSDTEELKATVDHLEQQVKTLQEDSQSQHKNFMKQLHARDAMYEQVSSEVGTFDHQEMTVGEVAKYACDKLELKNVTDGHEVTAVNAYFHNRAPQAAFAQDSKVSAASTAATPVLDKYFRGNA